jgi:hypothetical protein
MPLGVGLSAIIPVSTLPNKRYVFSYIAGSNGNSRCIFNTIVLFEAHCNKIKQEKSINIK